MHFLEDGRCYSHRLVLRLYASHSVPNFSASLRCSSAIFHVINKNARPAVAERQVSYLCGTGGRFAVEHQTTKASLACLYDTLFFSIVNELNDVASISVWGRSEA